MGETDYAGINYAGFGSTTNMDLDTGIRYGVIPAHEVGQAWWDESEPYYGEPLCPWCGNPIDSRDEGIVCETCGHEIEDMDEFAEEEPLTWYYEDEEISAEQPQDDTDIWVVKSKYFTYAQFCSPCAPGALCLTQWLSKDTWKANNRAYCFGHHWFEGGKAPYPVFDVETGEEVKPSDQS